MTFALLAGFALCAASARIARHERIRSAPLAIASVLITLAALEVYGRPLMPRMHGHLGTQDHGVAERLPPRTKIFSSATVDTATSASCNNRTVAHDLEELLTRRRSDQ